MKKEKIIYPKWYNCGTSISGLRWWMGMTEEQKAEVTAKYHNFHHKWTCKLEWIEMYCKEQKII